MVKQRSQSRSSASKYIIFSTRPEHFLNSPLLLIAACKRNNYLKWFEKCFGRPIIQETKKNVPLCLGTCAIWSTLVDSFHSECDPRALQTLKTLRILSSSSSSILSIRKGMRKIKADGWVPSSSAQELIAGMFHFDETTGNPGIWRERCVSTYFAQFLTFATV